MNPETELEIYQAVMRQIETLMGAKADSPEGAELQFLATVAQSYEERAFTSTECVTTENKG